MNAYEQIAAKEAKQWLRRMRKRPSLVNRFTGTVQSKVNSYIPEKVHKTITVAIREMVKAVLTGSGYLTSRARANDATLEQKESIVRKRIASYRTAAATEGGVTGAGGFLMNLADFPLLLGIKIKLLFDIASLYGFDVGDYRERLYLLYIFQLAFSSQEHRSKTIEQITNFERQGQLLPTDFNNFDWRTFQQQYRDYIDLVKLAQLLPFIGAAVGFIANYQLVKKLGNTAMQAYRLRILLSNGA